MPHSNVSGTDAEQTSRVQTPMHRIGASELSRAIVEAMAATGGAEGMALDELQRRVATALDEPLPPSFQEQLDVLLSNRYVERDPLSGTYRLTEAGEWLVQGIEVVHG